MPVDDDLRRALPAALTAVVQSAELRGVVDFDFSKLNITPRSSPTTVPAQAPAAAKYDVDFGVSLHTTGASMNVGVPLSDVKGTATLEGSSRDSRLAALTGAIDVSSLTLSGRDVSQFHAALNKIPQQDLMQLTNLQAKVAGGDLAGQVDWAYPDNAPGRYAMALALRNADVKSLTGDAAPQLEGRASASLALEGTIGDSKSRRGRGDVLVQGKELYKIPVLLGLWQVTNLALPITSPFSEATSRYNVDGAKVTFDSIELRSREMLMQGSGYLDFDNKKVRLTFITESKGWAKLPLVGDLIQGARNELLQIHVRGTIEEPTLRAGMMNTFSTTIDEVFKGREPAEKK